MRNKCKGLKILCVLLSVMLMLNYVVYADMDRGDGSDADGTNTNVQASDELNEYEYADAGDSPAVEQDEAENSGITDMEISVNENATDGAADGVGGQDKDDNDGNDDGADSGKDAGGDENGGAEGPDAPDQPENPENPAQPEEPDENYAYKWYISDTQANSFIIKNADELVEFAELVNGTADIEDVTEPVNFAGKTIKLEADIDLASMEWTSAGNTAEKAFKGCFDGNMHTIENLTMKPGVSYGGLFGHMYGEVRNVTVKNCNIYSDSYAGGIATVSGGNIAFCGVTGIVMSEREAAGGIVGNADGADIKGSFAAVNTESVKTTELAGAGTATVAGSYTLDVEADIDNSGDADKDTGDSEPSVESENGEDQGEAGYGEDPSTPETPETPEVPGTPAIPDTDRMFADAFASGEVSWLMNTVGGSEENHAVWSCDGTVPVYADDSSKVVYRLIACSDAAGGTITAAEMYLSAGADIKVSYTVDDGYRLREYALSYGCNTYMTAAAAALVMPAADAELRGVFVRIAESADGSRAWYLNNKESSYYFIESEREMVGLAQIVNGTAPECDEPFDFAGKTIILLSDLNFTQIDGVAPVGSSSAAPFAGTFDFDGHLVKNLTLTSDGDYVGIFGYLTGSVQNLNADGVYITGNKYCGVIAGYSAGEIKSCSAAGSVNCNEYAGGIVGYNDGSVSRTSSSAKVTGGSYVGGIAGLENGNISLSYSRGAVTADSVSGGIAGSVTASGVIEDSYTVSFVNNVSGNRVADAASEGTVSNTYYVKETTAAPDNGSDDGSDRNNESDENAGGRDDAEKPSDDTASLGEGKTRAQFYSGEVSWLLNTAGGQKKNNGAWSLSDRGPVLTDRENAQICRITVDCDNENGKVLLASLYVKSGAEIRPDVAPESGCRVRLFTVASASGSNIEFKSDYSFTMPEEDVVITASFYKVDTGKANSNMKVTFYYKGAGLPDDFTIPDQSIQYGMTAVEPEIPPVDGIIFEGWYTGHMEANGNISYVKKFDFRTAITDDTVLYLKWHEANAYAVTFIDNVRKGESDSKPGEDSNTEYVVEGELIHKPDTPVWDDKHVLNFWSREDSISGKMWNFEEDRMPATDIVLYAQWSILDMDFAETGGMGTADDPYQIKSVKQMELLSKKVMAGNAYEGTFFKLMNDITLGIAPEGNNSGEDNENKDPDSGDTTDPTDPIEPDPSTPEQPEEQASAWVPVGMIARPFQGNFAGDGNTINIYCINDPKTAGASASFKGIFGYLGESASVNGVNVVGKVSGYQYIGAVAGRNDGSISDCTNNAVIEVKELGGGIAGSSKGKITKCINNVALKSTKAYLGGIVGMSEGTVADCTNEAEALIDGLEHTGGIAGASKGRIDKCQNLSAVNGSVKYVGGIAGEGNVSNSHNEGAITGKDDANFIAGITGNGVASWCVNKGNISGVNYIGGIAGAGTVINSYNVADIKAAGGSAGGIAGQSVSVSFCYNTGNVHTVTDYAGGIAGAGPVSDCFNYGNITTDSTGQYFGKLTGIGNKTNSYYLAKTADPYGGKTADAFASGEVAWLLNTAGGAEDNIGFWSNNEEHPIISDTENGPVYAAIVEGGTNGSIDINSEKIIYGKSTDEIKVNINAHPDYGYKLSYIIINDERADTSFEMVESDLYISAVFEKDEDVVDKPSKSHPKPAQSDPPKEDKPTDFIGTGGGTGGGDGPGSGENGTGTGSGPSGINNNISGSSEVNAAETSENMSVTNEPDAEQPDTVLSSDDVKPQEEIAAAAEGASGGSGDVIEEEDKAAPVVKALKSVTITDVVSNPLIWILLGIMLAAALIWRYVKYRREK